MYRRYTLRNTNVVNAYNCILQAQNISNKQPCLFHQILISSQSLPSLIEHTTIDKIISQSENQNSINQTKDKFEFYLQQNLLHIRFKANLKPISSLSKMDINQILEIINILNLDLLISIKQLRSLFQNNQKNINNINKFYSQFIYKNACNQVVIPLIDQKKIHYYDLFYQETFYKNKSNQKKNHDKEERTRISLKRSKKKIEMVEDVLNSDKVVFQKYIHFLLILLNCNNLVDLLQEIKIISVKTPSKQDFNKRHNKLENSWSQKRQMELLQLLHKCINEDNQYNINIFIKECRLLLHKHQQLKIKTPRFSNQKYEESSANSFKQFKEQKQETQKSFLIKKQSIVNTQIENIPTKQSEKKLKTSKSLISLRFTNKSFLHPKNIRSLKRSSGNLSNLKQKFIDKISISQNQQAKITKQNRNSINSNSSTISMNSLVANWFNKTAKQNELLLKLRNFKKSNICTNTHSNISKKNQVYTQLHSFNTPPIKAKNIKELIKPKQSFQQEQIQEVSFGIKDNNTKELFQSTQNAMNSPNQKQIKQNYSN